MLKYSELQEFIKEAQEKGSADFTQIKGKYYVDDREVDEETWLELKKDLGKGEEDL